MIQPVLPYSEGFWYVGNTQVALAAENKEASVSPRTKMIRPKIYYKQLYILAEN